MLKEMGFNKEEIEKAAKIAEEKKVDIFDVLTKSAHSPPPQKYLPFDAALKPLGKRTPSSTGR